MNSHAPAFLKSLTPHEVLWGAVALAVLLVLGRMSRAVGHLAKAAAKTAAAPVAAASGGPGGGFKLKPLLLAGVLIGGVVLFLRSGIRPSAGHQHAAPGPAPQPTVTVTAPPKAAPPQFTMPNIPLPHLTGTQWTVITVVALFVIYAMVRPLLKRSS